MNAPKLSGATVTRSKPLGVVISPIVFLPAGLLTPPHISQAAITMIKITGLITAAAMILLNRLDIAPKQYWL